MALEEYFALVKQIDFDYLYTVTKQWLFYGFTLLGPVTFVYDAPFGRFATPHSVLSIDGIKAWIIMEIFSPLSFLVTAYLHPFSPTSLPLPSLSRPVLGINPPLILITLYLTHYLNRSLISPLRTPSRSKSHIVVVTASIVFNVLNGFLLSAYLTSTSTAAYLRQNGLSSPRFWVGIAMWAVGLAGNVYHDEILLNIRRKAIAKGKAKELENGQPAPQPHYAIPHGGLYSIVSYPNYFCEWVEWFGFALAASPIPNFALLPGAEPLWGAARGAQFMEMGRVLAPFVDSVSPPWVFFFLEIITMVPRAVRGHRWYHKRFKESYPRERRAVIPWLL